MKKYKDPNFLREKYQEEKLTQEEIAEQCGVSQASIRWYMSKYEIEARRKGPRSNKVDLSEEDIHFLEGLILGDGNLTKEVNVYYAHADNNRKYISWLKEKMKNMGMEILENDPVWSVRKWVLRTSCYANLTPLYDRWYPDGKKIIPEDIEITPTHLLLWYVGDGGDEHTESEKIYPGIGVYRLREYLPPVITQLRKKGIPCTTNSNGLYFSTGEEFFDYILSSEVGIPPGYKYKFPRKIRK